MSGLTCVALDLTHAAGLADPATRARITQLLRDMQGRAPETRFARLEATPSLAIGARSAAARLVRRALRTAAIVLPPSAVSAAEALSLVAVYRPGRSKLPTRVGAQVVFCPAVGPSLHDAGVPLVCGIDSLAFVAHPESFDVQEASVRGYLLHRALRLAARVVCPSEFVRGEVLAMAERVDPGRVRVIRPGMPASAPASSPELLSQLGLIQDEFLLCPGPFVGYQNHRMLLMAFGQYRASQPGSRLKLACLGCDGDDLPILEQSVKRMRLVDSVILRSEPADGLYLACRGVILPQVYEASGLTALIAMAVGVPVLSSGAGALREVIAEAGVSFDPRLPRSLIEAIALADRAPEGYRALGGRGRARFGQVSRGLSHAEQHLRLLAEVA